MCGADQHHRSPAHLPGRRRGRGPFVGKLFAHPFKDALGDGKFAPLGPYLRQLLRHVLRVRPVPRAAQ
jgi:hypothetical protein